MTGYISLKQLLDDILDHPLLKELSFERAVNHTVHFMRIMGCPRMFVEKTDLVEIEEYRGKLPCDFYEMIQVRTHKMCGGKDYKVFRYSTDSFHMSDRKNPSFDLTYKIQNDIIFTSMKEGTIEIAYSAFAVDSEGYPLIPDSSPFIRALELYIKKQYFTILFDMNKINQQVYNNVCQEYSFAAGQAQNDLIKLDIDKMQSLTNSLNTLIIRTTEHNRGFVNNGTQEKIKVQ